MHLNFLIETALFLASIICAFCVRFRILSAVFCALGRGLSIILIIIIWIEMHESIRIFVNKNSWLQLVGGIIVPIFLAILFFKLQFLLLDKIENNSKSQTNRRAYRK